MMQPDNIYSIHDFIRYCREVLADRPEYMSEKEQERSASALASACLIDSFPALERVS